MTEPYYRDDSVTLYHGDCLEITAWTAADVLVSDPPYGMNLLLEARFTKCRVCGAPSRSRSGTCKAHRETVVFEAVTVSGDSTQETRDAALRLWGEEKPGLIFGTWKVPRPESVRAVLIWDKGAVLDGCGDLSIPWGLCHEEVYVRGQGWDARDVGRTQGVIRVQRLVNGSHARPDHPTPKPIPLMERLIEKCPPGVIADPFAGSGSTLIAARNLGRKVIGVELEERYCELIAKRLDQMCLDFGG